MVNVANRPHIAEKIVFVDGLTGSGKTMMGSIMGSFKRVEIGKLEHIHEYLCALDNLKKIDSDAAVFMMSMYADLAIYNCMISREVNFRFTDLTGVFRNPNTFEYIKRLCYKDGNIVLDRIRQSKPILQILSHQALGVMYLAFRAFNQRLRVVEMVRHPLYLLKHWHSYIDRHGTDPRDFTIWIDYKGQALPWFASGWEEKYAISNSMDRVIYSIEWLMHKTDEMLNALDEKQKSQILILQFEKFVLNPNPYIEKIGELLSTEPTVVTKRVLQKQKCPRKQVAAGLGIEIYKKYGWKKPDPHSSELEELKKRRTFAASLASKEALKTLDDISHAYEKKYGLWF